MKDFATAAAESFRETVRGMEQALGRSRREESADGQADEVREAVAVYGAEAVSESGSETALQPGPPGGTVGEAVSPERFGERAALLAMAETAWRRHLGALLETRQVQLLMGVGTRQAVTDRAKRGRLLALETAGDRRLYPAFQFGPDGQPFPALPRALQVLADAGVSPYTIASWFRTPQPLLDGATPAEWMAHDGSEELLVEAAARAAAGFAH